MLKECYKQKYNVVKSDNKTRFFSKLFLIFMQTSDVNGTDKECKNYHMSFESLPFQQHKS